MRTLGSGLTSSFVLLVVIGRGGTASDRPHHSRGVTEQR